MAMSKEKISKIIKKLKKETKKCKTVEDYVDVAFSFKYEDFSILPLQKKGEIAHPILQYQHM